jgi:RNA polymerase sigma factor (sigma-70 family)
MCAHRELFGVHWAIVVVVDQSELDATAASDGWLVAQSVARPDVFAALFDRHFAVVHRYLARRVGVELADDLTSQTFVVAFERRASFDPAAGQVRAWLLGIATNLLRHHWRAEQRVLATHARLSRERTQEDHNGAREDIDPELAAALAHLDVGQRDVLFLVAWLELSYEEAAGALGVPVGTVRSRLARARGRLRAELAAEQPAPTSTRGER